jgi:hypothetical protein
MSINSEEIANLADTYARRITQSPHRDIDLILRELVIEAIEMGCKATFDEIYKRFNIERVSA